jgi:tetratricopeptide (TPR) repeat protein
LEFAGRLAELGSDPDIGRGALDIRTLHDLEALDPRRYGWWADKTHEYEDPPRGVWPADGFRALVRSLGGRYKQIGERRKAENYYRLAIDLRPYDVDPAAIRDLTQLYIEENQLPKVNLLAEEYEDRLFRAKGAAYRSSRLRKIFEFHRTLGVLYATIGRWGDSYRVDSAIFQLEHAQEKSREVEERAEGVLPEKYRFSPDMVNMLATGYVATDQPSRSYELRVEEAERFQQQGDAEAVRKVLEPIKTQELPVGLRSRIDGLAVSPAPTAAGRTLSSEVVAVDRFRRAAGSTVRIDLSRSRTRLPLSEEQLDLVAAQLQKNLAVGTTHVKSLDWGDAPGTPRELSVEDGNGVLVLQLEGNTHRIPFHVVSEGSSAAPR